MKILSRDFTLKEKVLLLVLVAILLGLAYYWFVDQPVRQQLENCAAQESSLQIELTAVQRKAAELERMKTELEAIQARDGVSLMSSYNASKEEVKLLNDVLAGTEQYAISFSDVSREGDQIRRNFSLQFTAPNHQDIARILGQLAESSQRCIIADIRCTRERGRTEEDAGKFVVDATATFYETMVGGTPDAALPAETVAAS